MRLTEGSGPTRHLTYCGGIHPGESWDEVFANLRAHVPPLRRRFNPGRPFGLGLRLSAAAARTLVDEPNTRAEFRNWLAEEQAYVFTINGSSYGGFHHQLVKDRAYAPDWSRPERLDYTIDLAHCLAVLLDDGDELLRRGAPEAVSREPLDGGITTVPLSYAQWWGGPADRSVGFDGAARRLAEVAEQLHRIEVSTGRLLHVDLEPEPGCLVEDTAGLIRFFDRWLARSGTDHLVSTHGRSPAESEALLRRHVQLCYDACNLAVAYEHPVDALDRIAAAGITVGKVQLSSAIRVDIPPEGDVEGRRRLADRLHPFVRSDYLHQVVERHRDGTLRPLDDLSVATPHLGVTRAVEWRIRYPFPVFRSGYDGLASTSDHLVQLLRALAGRPDCKHLEIETYTWGLLPADIRLDVDASITREYEWVLARLAQTGQAATRKETLEDAVTDLRGDPSITVDRRPDPPQHADADRSASAGSR